MPRAAQLKVFRTPVGFHDAYVAAPSQKAAIEAWGSGSDVFARGEAERVTDPDLMAEPLAQPGVVIKKLRGTAEEQLAALPPNKPRKVKTPKAEAKTPVKEKAPAKEKPRTNPKPRPSRAALDKAEQVIETAKEKHRAQMERVREKEAALAHERARLAKAQAAELEGLSQQRDQTAESYEEALKAWRAS